MMIDIIYSSIAHIELQLTCNEMFFLNLFKHVELLK